MKEGKTSTEKKACGLIKARYAWLILAAVAALAVLFLVARKPVLEQIPALDSQELYGGDRDGRPGFKSGDDRGEHVMIQNYSQTDVSFADNSDTPILQTWIAETPLRRFEGLSVLDELESDQAMLFVFENDDIYPFWMRNMKFPIDIMWLSADGHIVFIYEGAHPDDFPESYYPDTEARFVLETVNGFVQRYDIQVGDKIDFADSEESLFVD